MRYFLVSILIHILLVNFIWVGFSVPSERKGTSFIYLGEMIAPVQGGEQKKQTNFVINDQDSSAFFSPWLKMRQLNKPR